MSYNSQYNPLSKVQKAQLSQLAREAFEHLYKLGLIDAPGDTKNKQFTNWRRAQQAEAVDCESLTKCDQRDYLPLRAHFNSILGRDDQAFTDHLKSQPANDNAAEGDTVEVRAKKIHLIEAAIKGTKYRPEYVAAIAKSKFKKRRAPRLEDLSPDQLHQLLITIKERIRRDAKKTKAAATQMDTFMKALALVDWHYQYAEGRTYKEGLASYQKAEKLATTDELKAIFETTRKEKQG